MENTEKYALDNNKLIYLTHYLDQRQNAMNISIDFEKACDSHYIFSFSSFIIASQRYGWNSIEQAIIQLKIYFNTHSEKDFVEDFQDYIISQIHFDDY